MNFFKKAFGKGHEDKPDELNAVTRPALPNQPEMMMSLAERIVYTHVTKGIDSPVTERLAAEISFKLKLAREKHEEAMKYMKLASDALRDRDFILGNASQISPDNTSLKYYMQCVRDIVSEGDERTLGEWGFPNEYKKFKP